MKIKCELAPYKKSIYEDHDRGVIATLTFPLLEHYITEGNIIQEFSLEKFIMQFKESVIKVQVGVDTYTAVRLHGFELNQPLRLAFPDTGPPLILLVLQIYMPTSKIDAMYRKPLFIIL